MQNRVALKQARSTHLRGVSPNNSFKPTPHRGVNSVLYATLHAVATPPWGGLTQALGGKEHSAVASLALQLISFGQGCSSDGSSARCFFGQVRCARSHIACVALAGFGSEDLQSVGFSVSDALLRKQRAQGSQGALKRPVFGFRSGRSQVSAAGFRPA